MDHTHESAKNECLWLTFDPQKHTGFELRASAYFKDFFDRFWKVADEHASATHAMLKPAKHGQLEILRTRVLDFATVCGDWQQTAFSQFRRFLDLENISSTQEKYTYLLRASGDMQQALLGYLSAWLYQSCNDHLDHSPLPKWLLQVQWTTGNPEHDKLATDCVCLGNGVPLAVAGRIGLPFWRELYKKHKRLLEDYLNPPQRPVTTQNDSIREDSSHNAQTAVAQSSHKKGHRLDLLKEVRRAAILRIPDDVKGLEYCKRLDIELNRSGNPTTPASWRRGGCLDTHALAYTQPTWRQRIQDERSKTRRQNHNH
jgi:hypothetical protein